MALPTVPAWLANRSGAITRGIADHIAFVSFAGKPQYKLEVRPAKGKFSCVVLSALTGKPIDTPTEMSDSAVAAFENGLKRLQAKLGW